MAKKITLDMIQELRHRTGIGIGDCKVALEKSDGDIDTAIANLRKAGMASAVKKEGREAKEGMITFSEAGGVIAIVEINAETDFVVKNDRFQEFLKNIADEIAETGPESLEAFLAQKFSKEPEITIDQYRASIVQAIGENIQIRRFEIFKKNGTNSVGVYSHLGGKILTAVVIVGSDQEETLAKAIAMHIAAAAPEYVKPEEVPQNILEHEQEIVKAQMKGKPESIIGKIVEGKINAYYDDVCLTRQKFIRDDSKTVGELVSSRAKENGKELEISSFIRWAVGQ